MTGAGLKKCSPRTRSGRRVAAAIAATDSALVFVARITSAAAAASSARKIDRLSSRSSRAASMTRPRPRRPRRRACARRAALRAGRTPSRLVLSLVEVEARGPADEAVADPLPAAFDGGLVDVVEDDLVAVLEGELGDPGAHRPGPDDADHHAVPRSDRLEASRTAGGRRCSDRSPGTASGRRRSRARCGSSRSADTARGVRAGRGSAGPAATASAGRIRMPAAWPDLPA